MFCLDLLSEIRHCFCHTRNHFHRREHRSVCLLRSPLSGIKVLLIGVIIPLYADSLSLNPLRSTLCHAWLTCLRWCQVLAVSRRLPYATVLLSPLMSVKWMSAPVWRLSAVRCTQKHIDSDMHSAILYQHIFAVKVMVVQGGKKRGEWFSDERIMMLIWWWSRLASHVCVRNITPVVK